MQERRYIVIDQSGSMKKMNNSVYDGVQELIDSCDDNAHIVLITFNNHINYIYSGSKCDMNNIDFRDASGSTCLYDAIISAVTDSDSYTGICNIIICTDGIDTSSRNTQTRAKECVESFQNHPNNRITFLGVNQDAIFNAAAIGIPVGASLSVGTTHNEIRNAYRSVSENMAPTAGNRVEFSTLQRQQSLNVSENRAANTTLQRQQNSQHIEPPVLRRTAHIQN